MYSAGLSQRGPHNARVDMACICLPSTGPARGIIHLICCSGPATEYASQSRCADMLQTLKLSCTRGKIVLCFKYGRFLGIINTVLVTIICSLQGTLPHFSSIIITEVNSFVIVIYSAAGTHCLQQALAGELIGLLDNSDVRDSRIGSQNVAVSCKPTGTSLVAICDI